MTQSQLPSPVQRTTGLVGEAKDRQGAVLRAHVASIAWAFVPELRPLGLDGGERLEVLLSPVRERNSVMTGAELIEPWHLPTGVQNAVLAVTNELLGWIHGHGLVGMPRLTAVRAHQRLWVAAIDGGKQLPNFGTDPQSLSAGARVLKYSTDWGVVSPSEREERAAWALMWADGRPVRAERRTINQAPVSRGNA